MKIIFFGSTTDSVIVLDKLFHCQLSTVNCELVAVVTQPQKPIGRKQIMTPTPVEAWAKIKNIPVLTFPNNPEKPWLYQNEDDVVNAIESFKPDLLISASYGQMIPWECITHAAHGGLNIHPSLLPRWRGADPIPWTILARDAQTGVTIVSLSQKFDEGKLFAQKKINLDESALPDAIRTELFTLGTELLIETLPDIISGKNKGASQKTDTAIYARKLTRNDGFIPWEYIDSAMQGIDIPREKRDTKSLVSGIKCHMSEAITRMIRAFTPWPGVWTTIIASRPQGINASRNKMRMKILKAHEEQETLILDEVQVEGKNPVKWNEIKKVS